MVKKIISLMLSIVLIFCVSIVAYAESPVITPGTLEQIEADVVPCFEYTDSTTTTLSISTSGKAICSATIYGYSGTTTKIVVNMTLQKKTLFWWSTEESWSTTVNNWHGTFTENASVSSGTYRVKVEFTVYSGSNSEEVTTYSQEKTF